MRSLSHLLAHVRDIYKLAQKIEVEGMRIGGISGVFRHTIWHPSEPPRWKGRQSFRDHVLARRGELFEDHLPFKHWSTIFPEDLEPALSNI